MENVLTGERNFRVALTPLASQFNGEGVLVNGVYLDMVAAPATPPDQGNGNVACAAACIEETIGLLAVPSVALASKERQHRLPPPTVDRLEKAEGVRHFPGPKSGSSMSSGFAVCHSNMS